MTPNLQITQFLHFALPLGEHRDFKFGMQVHHNKSQPTDKKLSLKSGWSWSRDLFKFWQIIGNISGMVQYRET